MIKASKNKIYQILHEEFLKMRFYHILPCLQLFHLVFKLENFFGAIWYPPALDWFHPTFSLRSCTSRRHTVWWGAPALWIFWNSQVGRSLDPASAQLGPGWINLLVQDIVDFLQLLILFLDCFLRLLPKSRAASYSKLLWFFPKKIYILKKYKNTKI